MVLVGLLVMAGPFISVSRAGTQMLAELPEIDGADFIDERVGWSAVFNDDLVVARRTYSGVTEQVVADALRSDGYETLGVDGFSRTCCGEYDAVWITISASESGTVVAELQAADADWQSSWPVFAMIGLILSTGGIALLAFVRARSRRGDHIAPSTQHHPTPVGSGGS